MPRFFVKYFFLCIFKINTQFSQPKFGLRPLLLHILDMPLHYKEFIKSSGALPCKVSNCLLEK